MTKSLEAFSQKSVGGRLDLIRLAMDMEAKELAEAIGSTQQNWWNWKEGVHLIPVPAAIRLCLYTGANLDFIYRNDRAGLLPAFAEKLRAVESPPKAAKRA